MVDNILKKALLFQAEIVSMASEKVQEVASSYVEKGTLHDADAKKFVSEVREKLETTEKDLEEKFSKFTKMFQEIGIPGKQGETPANESLEDEISRLERRLEELKIKKEISSKKA